MLASVCTLTSSKYLQSFVDRENSPYIAIYKAYFRLLVVYRCGNIEYRLVVAQSRYNRLYLRCLPIYNLRSIAYQFCRFTRYICGYTLTSCRCRELPIFINRKLSSTEWRKLDKEKWGTRACYGVPSLLR